MEFLFLRPVMNPVVIFAIYLDAFKFSLLFWRIMQVDIR
jgi:hypothetical protein